VAPSSQQPARESVSIKINTVDVLFIITSSGYGVLAMAMLVRFRIIETGEAPDTPVDADATENSTCAM